MKRNFFHSHGLKEASEPKRTVLINRADKDAEKICAECTLDSKHCKD